MDTYSGKSNLSFSVYSSLWESTPKGQNLFRQSKFLNLRGSGRVCRGVILIWIIVWQGPTALAVGVDRVFGQFFSRLSFFSLLSPSLWETSLYRLKYRVKGPKQTTCQFPLRNCHLLERITTQGSKREVIKVLCLWKTMAEKYGSVPKYRMWLPVWLKHFLFQKTIFMTVTVLLHT